MEKNTAELDHILLQTTPDTVGDYLLRNKEELIDGAKPFAAHFRRLLREKGLTQQEVIFRAGFSEKYGYRLLSEERHTRQRDYILRLCFGAGCTEEELQRLLKLYGFSPLYARVPRDAVLLTLLHAGESDLSRINAVLRQNGLPELRSAEE